MVIFNKTQFGKKGRVGICSKTTEKVCNAGFLKSYEMQIIFPVFFFNRENDKKQKLSVQEVKNNEIIRQAKVKSDRILTRKLQFYDRKYRDYCLLLSLFVWIYYVLNKGLYLNFVTNVTVCYGTGSFNACMQVMIEINIKNFDYLKKIF